MPHISQNAFAKAAGYLESQVLHTPLQGPRDCGRPFVTISRESGAGASTFAQILAERLNHQRAAFSAEWKVYGANLILEMLEINHLSPRIAQFLPESRISETNALVGELVGLHPSLWELAQKTNALMRELAQKGNAIFIGRGAVFATAGFPHGVHVRLIASAEYRAQRTAERLGFSKRAAMAHNAKVDAARRGYVRNNFDAYGPDPKWYDLVVNTGQLPMAAVVELTTTLVRTFNRPVAALK